MKGIKIVGDGGVANTRVFDGEGNDLTQRLWLRSVVFAHTVGELPVALLECLVAEIDVPLNELCVASNSDCESGGRLLIESQLLRRNRDLEARNRHLNNEMTELRQAQHEAWQNERRRITIEYWERMGSPPRSTPVHCDDLVLHAPGKCSLCDECAPGLQRRRMEIGMNFTGEIDPMKLPDPATLSRPETTINRWGGNVAQGMKA